MRATGISKGQVLVRIDPEAAAAVAAAEAGIAQAQTAPRMRVRNMRVRAAWSSASSSAPVGLDGARTQFEAAEAQLRAARAQREQVATVWGYAEVASAARRPIAARHIEAGDGPARAQPAHRL